MINYKSRMPMRYTLYKIYKIFLSYNFSNLIWNKSFFFKESNQNCNIIKNEMRNWKESLEQKNLLYIKKLIVCFFYIIIIYYLKLAGSATLDSKLSLLHYSLNWVSYTLF